MQNIHKHEIEISTSRISFKRLEVGQCHHSQVLLLRIQSPEFRQSSQAAGILRAVRNPKEGNSDKMNLWLHLY